MMDDACQTKVGAGAKCAPTIASASNNFSVTTCIAAGQQVSPASSADTSNKENKLSTGAIAGISIGALVFVAAVAVMVIAIVKRRASRQRNPREVMASMVEVQVDQAVMNPATPAQGSADVDPTLVEVPANEHLL
jgi:putative exporter of polyketide antibiotics